MDLLTEGESLEASVNLLAKQEGFRAKVYDDKTGKTIGRLPTGGWPTVGYGLNLSADGLTEGEAMLLLKNRVADLFRWLDGKFAWFRGLNPTRKAVVCSVVYNVGREGFLGFKRLIKALSVNDHLLAGREIEDSDAARLLPERYKSLREMMEVGR